MNTINFNILLVYMCNCSEIIALVILITEFVVMVTIKNDHHLIFSLLLIIGEAHYHLSSELCGKDFTTYFW